MPLAVARYRVADLPAAFQLDDRMAMSPEMRLSQFDRVELLDSSIATLDFTRTRNVRVEGNSFNNVNQPIMNPVTLAHSSVRRLWSDDYSRAIRSRRVAAARPRHHKVPTHFS